MPEWVVGKITEALNTQGKAIRGSRVLVLGVAYKPNVDDPRESPSVEIMQKLEDLGANVAYSDPYFPVFPSMRKYQFDLQSVELTPESLQDFDCVLIGTHHDAFDYEVIEEHATLIVDARGVFRGAVADGWWSDVVYSIRRSINHIDSEFNKSLLTNQERRIGNDSESGVWLGSGSMELDAVWV